VRGAQGNAESKRQSASHFGQCPAGQQRTLRSENGGTKSEWPPDVRA